MDPKPEGEGERRERRLAGDEGKTVEVLRRETMRPRPVQHHARVGREKRKEITARKRRGRGRAQWTKLRRRG
jgi:hypothetical protein